MTRPPETLAPGATIGILGGGQLGRMLAMAAAQLGYRCHVLDPDAQAPAADVCAYHVCADYADSDALVAFAASVDVITYEFENVPVAAIEHLSQMKPVRPGAKALAVAQDRLSEKSFASRLGIACAPHAAIDNDAMLHDALRTIGTPAILKTRRMGYDGKGQARIGSPEDASAAWEAIGKRPAILEKMIAFDCEVSVLVARGADDAVVSYGPILNEHEGGILRRSVFPAQLDPRIASTAIASTAALARALDYVGLLAVEYFVAGDELLFNEMAPRVHNSGHGTIEGSYCSQFENHIRAICGLPLGNSTPRGTTEMRNLIGDEAGLWKEILADPAARLHLYGKHDMRPGRKMGHVTRLLP